MRHTILCVLLLAISEPLLIHAKVVLVVPRPVRRATSWRPPSQNYKKSSYGGNDFHRQSYYNHINRYYNRKPYQPPPYPQGGDSFDQGHEPINHVHIPYGKDIGHGISFGKGYIPYENIKSSNVPFVHERYAGAYTRQPTYVPNYPPTGFTSVGQEYATSATTHSFQNPQIDSFFSDVESAARGAADLPDSLKDSANKYYASRSIEKELSLRNQQTLGSVVERDNLAKNTEELTASKDASLVTYNQPATAGMQGAVVLPAGIPPATIAGNKEGIVLRDTVSLDEYHRKLQELTKTWPNVLSAAGSSPGYAAISPHELHTVGLPSAGLPTGYGAPTGAGWLSSSFAQPKQGYAVREDTGDSRAHDFRTMPTHASYQQLPLGVNVGLPGGTFGPAVHG